MKTLARPRLEQWELVADPLRRTIVEAAGRAMVSSHWGGECWFAMRLEDDLEVRAYPLPAAGGLFEGGGFEMAAVLDRRPRSNRLRFKVGSHGLRCYRQPDGSHAVYHASRAGNFRNVHYRAGKAFHILRPWAEDAAGRRVWCDLRFGQAGAVLDVPQWFLDDASYPVLVDPTFGYTSAGASSISFITDSNLHCQLVGVYAATSGDQITDMQVYAKKTSANTDVQFAAYTIVSGHGQSRLAAAVQASVTSSTAGWVAASGLAQTMAAATYGVAIGQSAGQTNEITAFYDTGAGNNWDWDSTHATLPATYTHDTYFSERFSIFATYTAAPKSLVTVPRPTALMF